MKYKIGDIVKIKKIWLNKEMFKDINISRFNKYVNKIGRIINICHTYSEYSRYVYILDINDSNWNWRELKKTTKNEKTNYLTNEVIKKL